MNIIFIYLGVFLAILGIAIAVKLLKSVIKIAFFISFVLFIFLFVSGYFIISDANEFKDEFPSSQKTFLMTKDEVVEAGFIISGTEVDEVEFINKEDLDNLTEQVNSGDIDIGDNYKIFIAKYEMFEESLVKGVMYEDLNIDQELADEVFASDDPVTVLAKETDAENWLVVREQLEDNLGSPTEAKGALFAVLMMDGMTEGPTYLIENLKSNNLEVYPTSPMFIALEIVPEGIYDKVTGGEDEVEVLGEG